LLFLECPLSSGNTSVLVDAGKGLVGKTDIDKFLLYNLKVSHLDIIVVTHNDRDHSGGIRKVLNNDIIIKKEIYLPALWFDRVEDAIDKPTDFFRELLDDITSLKDKEVSYNYDECFVQDEDGGSFDKEVSFKNADQSHDKETFLNENVKLQKKVGRALHIYKCKSCRKRIVGKKKMSNKKLNALNEALAALSEIIEIYSIALEKNLNIRWFEYDKTNDLRGNLASINKLISMPVIRPVNSKYIQLPRMRKYRAYYYIHLNRLNRRSLVFVHEGDGGDILFCADSLLHFDLPYSVNLLATTPHHGRKSNDIGLKKLLNVKQFPKTMLIRNSHNVYDWKKLSSVFVNLKGSPKYCDKCFDTRSGRIISLPQVIEVILIGANWCVSTPVNQCNCC